MLGENHPYVAFSLMNLGIYLQDDGQWSQAKSCYQKAISIYGQNYDENHPAIASSFYHLGKLYQETGQPDSAEIYYQQALLIVQTQDSPRDPDRVAPLVGLGSLYLETGRIDTAETLLRTALRIRERQFPSGHWKMSLTQSLLGASLAENKMTPEAADLLTSGYEGLKSRLGSEHELTREASRRLTKYNLR